MEKQLERDKNNVSELNDGEFKNNDIVSWKRKGRNSLTINYRTKGRIDYIQDGKAQCILVDNYHMDHPTMRRRFGIPLEDLTLVDRKK